MTATGQVEAAASESFSASRELFESVAGFLDGTEAAGGGTRRAGDTASEQEP